MLSEHIRILNFDDSVTRQTEFIDRDKANIVDLTGVGPAARLWADPAQADAIRRSLNPDQRSWITFLGSGDYHYVSSLLLEQFDEPLTLVVFDHHPDWDRMPPRYGCGAWVSRALERKNIDQIILVGNASEDLAFPSILTGNVGSAKSGRLVMAPFSVPRRQVWPLNGIPWHPLESNPEGAFSDLVDQMPRRKVYVSIDKDCLTAPYALTNWEEGRLSLDLLFALIRVLKQKCEIIGLDVTGEYSSGKIPSRWKSWCSNFDHPHDYSARGHSLDEIDSVNGTTNRRIIELLSA
jgi:hypothetical protein